MVRTPLVLALVLVSAALAAGQAAGATTPRLLSCGGKPLLRPAGTVVLACADANTLLKATRWRAWNARSATGTTDFGLNLCNPYCAASPITWFRNSRVTLTAPKRTAHGLLFTRVVVTYSLHGKMKRFVAYPAT